jgi:hypothetical protein
MVGQLLLTYRLLFELNVAQNEGKKVNNVNYYEMHNK